MIPLHTPSRIGFYDWHCSCNLFQVKANTRLSSFEPEDIMLRDDVRSAVGVVKVATFVGLSHTWRDSSYAHHDEDLCRGRRR